MQHMTIIMCSPQSMNNALSNDTLMTLIHSFFTEHHWFQNDMSKTICDTF